jgi:hypothetical protein
MKKIFAFFITMFFSATSFAMFCPSGFNEMNIGDSIEQVVKSCGTPDNQKTTKTVPGQPQEWNYYVKADPTQPGTFKMSIAFNSDQKVINISVNGTSVVTTPICGGASVQYGSTTDEVKSACGKPAFVNESQQQTGPSAPTPTEMTELLYNTTPPVTLLFVNGKLKERR